MVSAAIGRSGAEPEPVAEGDGRGEEDGVKEQLSTFEQACKGLPYPRSIANSAGIVRWNDVGGDIVRPGIMLYGATPFPYDTAEMIGVRPVMRPARDGEHTGDAE